MDSSSREVLIIDLRGVITRDESTILRHLEYGKYLTKVSDGKLALTILTRGNATPIRNQFAMSKSMSKFLITQEFSFNLLRYILMCIKYIRKNRLNVSFLVSGDPWETYWYCRFLRFCSRSELRIQVQLHADIFDPNWKQLSAMNKIRFRLLFLNSNSIHSFRLVNVTQKQELLKRFPKLRDRVFVAPVPLSISPYTVSEDLKVAHEPVIGFVGRIHKDRGLTFFTTVVERLNQDGWKGQVLVIGGGSEEKSFREELERIIGNERLSFEGMKSGEELRKYWNKIDIFLNSASTESYGRSTREALYYGKVVLCLETNGIAELSAERASGQLQVIDPNKPESWITSLRESSEFKPGVKYSDQIWAQNEQDKINLVSSWE